MERTQTERTRARSARADRPVVLVASADLGIRLPACEALEADGFAPQEIESGGELIESLAGLRPVLIVLDAELPPVGGLETSAELRKRSGAEHTPVLLLTEPGAVAAADRAYAAGVTDFVVKPILWPLFAHRARHLWRASEAFAALRESQARLADAQRLAGLGHWNWDLATGGIEWSEQLHRILGSAPVQGAHPAGTLEALLGHVHPEDQEALRAGIERARSGALCEMDHRILLPTSRGGTERVVHHVVEAVRGADGRPTRLTGTVQDVTDHKRAAQQIWRLAFYDGLTGLPNRRLFAEHLNRAIKIARRRKRQLGLIVLGVDRFKRINESLGHRVGDQLLEQVAGRLVEQVRDADCVARSRIGSSGDPGETISRLGGDEFTVLLHGMNDPQDAAKAAHRVLDGFARPFEVEGRELLVTASIGIAVHPFDGESAEELLQNAGAALNHAKQTGRADCRFYSDSLNSAASERLDLESRLGAAIDANELLLHYQPKIHIASGKVTGFEALLRWQERERGLIPPAEFVPLAEEAGLISAIGEWVLREACAQAVRWRSHGFAPPRIAVNLSSHQIRESGLTDLVSAILAEHGMAPGELELELTESAIMKDEEAAARILSELKELGVGLAMDDFGTGYSSMGYLKRFRFDSLKLDRSFVRDCATDPNDAAIARAIIAMGKSLNLKVVAEGVETQEQQTFLREQGCDEMQGFLLARPMPAAACVSFLKKR